MLSGVGEGTTEEEEQGGGEQGEEQEEQGREGERGTVAALRVREARLRAMQTRIDLLASEFALLRNTRRELRRVNVDSPSPVFPTPSLNVY